MTHLAESVLSAHQVLGFVPSAAHRTGHGGTWRTLSIPALARQRQEDPEFKVILSCLMRLYIQKVKYNKNYCCFIKIKRGRQEQEGEKCPCAKGWKYHKRFPFGSQSIAQKSECTNLGLHGWTHQLGFELEDTLLNQVDRPPFRKYTLWWRRVLQFWKGRCQLWNQL